jgi:hypothetical protein
MQRLDEAGDEVSVTGDSEVLGRIRARASAWQVGCNDGEVV